MRATEKLIYYSVKYLLSTSQFNSRTSYLYTFLMVLGTDMHLPSNEMHLMCPIMVVKSIEFKVDFPLYQMKLENDLI